MKLKDFLASNKATQKELDTVKKFLEKASDAYYNSKELVMTDEMYDKVYNHYRKLGGEEIIGAAPQTWKKGTIQESHSYKNLAGTLDKAQNPDDVIPYIKKWMATQGRPAAVPIKLSLKFDGNSITIEYDKTGKVLKAITRGKDGKGKDLTSVFKNFSLNTDFAEEDENFAIKYECIISYENYEKICKEFDEDYANPRSLISGILGSDDVSQYINYITLVPLELRLSSGICYDRHTKMDFEDDIELFYPDNWYNEYRKDIKVKTDEEFINAVLDYYNHVNEIREDLPFMIDGIVIDILDETIIKEHFYHPNGTTPKHSIALKLPYLEKMGVVTGIDYCVGNSGRITPRIHFSDEEGNPILFNGTEHTKQQISNYKRFNEMKLGVGSKISVAYRNDCLSYITKLDDPDNAKIKPFVFPKECPTCGAKIKIIENAKTHEKTIAICENSDCPSRILGKIENYFERMDIKGIKMNTIEKMFEEHLIDSIPSIYEIDYKKASKILGNKTAQNIKEAISEKQYYDYEILGSLSIEKISTETAKIICKKYDIQELLDCDYEEEIYDRIINLEGFSDIKTNHFVKGFVENWEIIDYLAKRGYKSYKEEFKNMGEGLSIVFTGFRNPSWEFELEKQGHKVKSSVSKKTNILVASNDPGATKMNKAKELGIQIMNIDEFAKKFNLS